MSSLFFWPLTGILATFLEILVQDLFSLVGFSPKVLLLSTLFFSVRMGPIAGECLGFLWGLVLDSCGLSLFGSQTFLLTAIGYFGGTLKGKIDETIPFAQMSLVCGISLLYIGGLILLEFLFGDHIERFWSCTSLLEPLLAGILAPLFFALFSRWQRILKVRI